MYAFARPLTLFILSSGCLALNLTETLNATTSLSRINAILNIYPSLLPNLTGTQLTFFAPSNDALDSFILSQGEPSNITLATLVDLISYHIVPQKLLSTDLTLHGGAILNTQLNSTSYANLDGEPNVVYASAFGSNGLGNEQGSLMLYSGVGEPANVASADVEFEGGVLHIIDRNTLIEAFRKADLWQTVDSTPKVTCFAPTDEAFQAAGIDVPSLSEERLANLLKYHLIEGEVRYSTALDDGTQYQTMLGVPVTVHKRDGQIFVNNVTVRKSNIIMSNGVMHILDRVLDVLTGVLTPSPNATISVSGTSSTTSQTVTEETPTPSSASGTNAASLERPAAAHAVLALSILVTIVSVAIL